MSSLNVPSIGSMNPPILRRLEALEVGEILDAIMLFLDEYRDLFAASLVCKTWTPIALDHLWRTLNSVDPLCRLLGPMQYLDGFWRFTDTILGADWTRFEFYSQKVRRIDNDFDGGELGHGTLTQVLNIRPPSIPYILPRVTEINWTEQETARGILDLTPLFSPTLKSFALTNTSNPIDVGVVLRHLVFLPGLKLEGFHARWESRQFEGPLCDVLDRHRDSLKSFSHHSFEPEERLLNSLTQLVNLTNLELELYRTLRTDEDCNNFSDVLASRCPGLKKIRFRFPFQGIFTFYAIQPLMRIKRLREISMKARHLDLKVEDFREMGDAWRSLVALGFPNSLIPLPWLATITEHFSPTLEYINMWIQVPDGLNPDYTTLTPLTPSLKRISFIESAEPETFDAVGSFFCKLAASNTVVECSEGMGQYLRMVTGNSVKWETRGW
ncbi:hypothetical protein FRC04_002706 [Tulasnella sp. 424]|nr:hypothetical protein FRC04_002706 [Tulasnella sp. 424]